MYCLQTNSRKPWILWTLLAAAQRVVIQGWGCAVTQSCLTLCDPVDCSPPGSSVQDSPGKDTGVGFHVLLQRIFPTQGLNPPLLCLLHCRQILYLWVTGGAQSRENQKIYIISPKNVKKWRIKKEHKVDGTTIKHSIRCPPQAPRKGDALKKRAHTKQARCGLGPGEESGGFLASSLLTAWTLAPWACRVPSKVFLSLPVLPLSMPLFHSILRASPQNFKDNWIFKMYYLFFKTHTKKKLKKSKS